MGSILSGCSKSVDARTYGAVCELYLVDLPKEYEQLPEEIRKDTAVYLSIRNVSSDKTYSIELTDANEYRHSLNLIPGTYSVSKPYISNDRLVPLNVETKIDSISITKNSKTEVPIYVSNPSDFINAMTNNQPKDEILNADIYSRKVQYNGKIIDLNNIREEIAFSTPKNDERLAPAATYYIPSANDEGISLIVQNQSDARAPVSQATLTGVRFRHNNIVFPKGITLGSTSRDIAHTREGKLGTPTYCLGSPLIGFEFDDTTLVYIDENSGDRISFDILPGDKYVSIITYEFFKYE